MNKQEKMAELIESIRALVKQEEILLIRASKKGCEAAMLRAKEEQSLNEAKQCETRRYELSLEYNQIKNPCSHIIVAAEAKLGRKLDIDEVFEIERIYAKKTTKHSTITAH